MYECVYDVRIEYSSCPIHALYLYYMHYTYYIHIILTLYIYSTLYHIYTGETPRKNIDVMSAVSQQIAQQAAAKIAEGEYYTTAILFLVLLILRLIILLTSTANTNSYYYYPPLHKHYSYLHLLYYPYYH